MSCGLLAVFLVAFNLLHLGAEVAFLLNRPVLAVELYPWDYRYPFYVGTAHLLRGNYESAEFYFQRTIRLFPTFIEAKNNLAATWAMMGRISEAEALLREVLAVDSGYESARENLSRLLRHLP